MEAEMVPSLTPLLQGADEWGEVLVLLPLLVALEAVLSADNAIALAAISRRLHDPARQRQALNLGLLMALVLRMALILAARWVLDAWPLQLAAAAYLLWLCGRHLIGLDDETDDEPEDGNGLPESEPLAVAVAPLASSAHTHDSEAHHRHGPHHGHAGPTLASIALTLALTDLAFSLDSVAAAVAVTDRLALVMAGGLLGVLALRLTAGLFVRWLELFSRLETAGYLAVGLVGIRLLLRLLLPDLELPEWVLLLLVATLFVWGFSERSAAAGPPEAGEVTGTSAGAPEPTPVSGNSAAAESPLP
jgi:YkoY family integral membrane protein